MLNKSKVFAVIVIFTVIGCAMANAWLQRMQFNAVHAQSEIPKLTLEFSAEQNTYVQLEPILIRFKLSNQTNAPIKYHGLLGLGSQLNFLVRQENGEVVRLDSFYNGNRSLSFYTMQPNNSYERKELLEEKILEAVFPHPGRYEVRVEFTYSKDIGGKQQEKIISNPVTFEIHAPQGINKQAYDYIKQTLEPKQNKVSIEELVQLRQHFMDNFGNSVYGKYIAIKLAGNYQMLGDDGKAERELCKIANVNFIYSDQVKQTLQKLAAKLRPMPLIPNLPQNVPLPPKPRPCSEQ